MAANGWRQIRSRRQCRRKKKWALRQLTRRQMHSASSFPNSRWTRGNKTVHADYLRQFVVNALVLHVAPSPSPGLVQLFHDLRYEMQTETPPHLKGLPIVTFTSCLTSFRPAD